MKRSPSALVLGANIHGMFHQQPPSESLAISTCAFCTAYWSGVSPSVFLENHVGMKIEKQLYDPKIREV
jgi:hypothetical protein